MNKIIVDPTLFITCRLCLEEIGIYQIVPAVQEQILYCFGIKVEPFDGLPQLICKTCEAVLSNTAEIKKKYINKQVELQNRLQHNIQDGQISPNQSDNTDTTENNKLESNKNNQTDIKRRNSSVSSLNSALELEMNEKNNSKNGNIHENLQVSAALLSNYNKRYVCRFCNSRLPSISILNKHMKSKHSVLRKKYSNIFKNHCEVRLQKLDHKPNVTGSDKKVMHNNNAIIENVDPKYYILYSMKSTKDNKSSSEDEDSSRNKSTKPFKPYPSSESEDEIIVKRKKKRRLCSDSSNDTVVLNTCNNSNASDDDNESRNSKLDLDECINIEDSSDNDSDDVKSASVNKTNEKKGTKPDLTLIKNIITSCKNKYMKKQSNVNVETNPNKNRAELAFQLKRKILSIGRKLISKKKSVNCTPLLRFMEHKNLDIIWLPRCVTYVNVDSNYLRIFARNKNFGELMDSVIGWTNYSAPQNLPYKKIIIDTSIISKENKLPDILFKEPEKLPNGIMQSNFSCPNISENLSEGAVLIADVNISATDTKKLLNANPVANPKQLPKKSIANEIKTAKNPPHAVSSIDAPTVENNEADPDFCMPIITSTTSLAVPFTVFESNDTSHEKQADTDLKKDNQTTEVPRIKVKPPSELMSEETLNRMKEPSQTSSVSCTIPTSVHNQNFINTRYMPLLTPNPSFQNNLQGNKVTVGVLPERMWNNDLMILDTVELPNMTTNSPFQYFKKLLQIHNIILLDTDTELSNNFHCLIKFKVSYKQDTNVQPVVLCLSLFCFENAFCMKIKDCNQENINISRISPNWQWEVLKIYKGEVVNKLLQNARRVSNDAYKFTNSFLCLLKSINLIKSA